MKSPDYRKRSRRSRWAGALLAPVLSLTTLASTLAMFASASGELDLMLATLRPAASASAASSTPAARRNRS